MSKRKLTTKVYGVLTRYWPKEMLPFVLAAACMMVVLENTEKASEFFDEAVETWGRKDSQAAPIHHCRYGFRMFGC